jgi:hypothetical protein
MAKMPTTEERLTKDGIPDNEHTRAAFLLGAQMVKTAALGALNDVTADPMGVAVVKEAVLSAINDVTADLVDAARKQRAALRPVVREAK